MKAVVTILLKDGVLDAPGRAIGQALASLGFPNVRDVRAGRVIELDLDAPDAATAKAQAADMARKLLANTVIERFHVEVKE